MSDTEPAPKSEAELKAEIQALPEKLQTFMKDALEEHRDLFDHDFKGVTALLVAHGAGIAGCLTLLKDATQVPHLKGIGAFILMFAVGFCLAVLGYILLGIMRHRMMLSIMQQRTNVISVMALRTPERSRPPPEPPGRLMVDGFLIIVGLSAFILLSAVMLAGWKLSNL